MASDGLTRLRTYEAVGQRPHLSVSGERFMEFASGNLHLLLFFCALSGSEARGVFEKQLGLPAPWCGPFRSLRCWA